MNDFQKIAQWILSDVHINAPIYTDLLKKVIPLYGSILPNNINYQIEREAEFRYYPGDDLTLRGRKFDLDDQSSTMVPNEYLHIFLTDQCYRPEYKHSMETLITVIKTDKIQPSDSPYHLRPNNIYFSINTYRDPSTSIPPLKYFGSPYMDTIFNYLYVMKHVREHKLNLLLSSSKDDVKNEIKKNSPEYSDTSNE